MGKGDIRWSKKEWNKLVTIFAKGKWTHIGKEKIKEPGRRRKRGRTALGFVNSKLRDEGGKAMGGERQP